MIVNSNVRLLESTRGAYVYLIDGPEKVLVDTGFPWAGRGIVRELKSIGVDLRDIRHIVLTHYDVDHVGNAELLRSLTGATLWASETEIPYIMGKTPRPGFKKHLVKIFRYKKPREIRALGESLGGIRVISSPGHTPGHICLVYDGVLFAGDIVENGKEGLRPYPTGWNWDMGVMMESLKALTKLDFTWVCPAHGRPFPREGNWEKLMPE